MNRMIIELIYGHLDELYITELLSSLHFLGENTDTLLRNILSKTPKLLKCSYSVKLKDFIFKMLEKQKSKRPIIVEIFDLFPSSYKLTRDIDKINYNKLKGVENTEQDNDHNSCAYTNLGATHFKNSTSGSSFINCFDKIRSNRLQTQNNDRADHYLGTRNNSQTSIRSIYYKENAQENNDNEQKKKDVYKTCKMSQLNLKKNFKFKIQYNVHDLLSDETNKIAPHLFQSAHKEKINLKRLKQQSSIMNRVTSLDALPAIKTSGKDATLSTFGVDEQIFTTNFRIKDQTSLDPDIKHSDSALFINLNKHDSIISSTQESKKFPKESILISDQKETSTDIQEELREAKQNLLNQRASNCYPRSIIKQLIQTSPNKEAFSVYNDNCSSFKRIKRNTYARNKHNAQR